MTTLADFPDAHTFIETGYGVGATLERAMARPYRRIVTVEVHADVVRDARARVAGDPRVEVWHGSSADVLPAIIDGARSTVFWLDAHWSGGGWPGDDGRHDAPQCPILGELAAITAAPWTAPVTVLIDDAPFFRAPPPPPFRAADWPTIADIRRALDGWDETPGDPDVLRFARTIP